MSSSIGVFGGRGGGGGPGFALAETALCLDGGGGALAPANLPASANGGGALNFGRGGDGVLSGDFEGSVGCRGGEDAVLLSSRLFRAGGGAGGGPLFDDIELPVFCGLRELSLPGAAAGGGGGAFARPP